MVIFWQVISGPLLARNDLILTNIFLIFIQSAINICRIHLKSFVSEIKKMPRFAMYCKKRQKLYELKKGDTVHTISEQDPITWPRYNYQD